MIDRNFPATLAGGTRLARRCTVALGEIIVAISGRLAGRPGAISKFEAHLAKVLLGFVILEGSYDFLQDKTAVDNGL